MSAELSLQRLLSDDDDFKKFLLSKFSEKSENTPSLIINDDYIQNLKSLSLNLEIENDLKKGDLVKWKQGLKNRRIPEYNQPAIVMEVLQEPIIINHDEYGSATYREPLGIVLGIITPKNEFLIFHYDKRRFEKF